MDPKPSRIFNTILKFYWKRSGNCKINVSLNFRERLTKSFSLEISVINAKRAKDELMWIKDYVHSTGSD